MKRSITLTIILTVSVFACHAQNWIYSLEAAKMLAKVNHKLIIIDFYADWCGPCHKMEADTWSKQSVGEQMEKMIPVKIDIDNNRNIALEYNVKAIPTTIITDCLGNELYSMTGYMNADQMLSLLNGFPGSVEPITLPLQQLEADAKNPDVHFNTALAYQNLAKSSNGKGKSILLNKSYQYLASAKKFYKKEKNATALEAVELQKCYNKIIDRRSKSALKDMEKLDLDQLEGCNRALACFILVNGYMSVEDTKQAEKYLVRLTGCAEKSKYLPEIGETYPELASTIEE